jgi:hypothetical protein
MAVLESSSFDLSANIRAICTSACADRMVLSASRRALGAELSSFSRSLEMRKSTVQLGPYL